MKSVGTVADVQRQLGEDMAKLKADGDIRHAALTDAVVGGAQRVLSGLPSDGQATITAQISERTENGTHVLTQVYVDVTVVAAAPAPAVGDAPRSVEQPAAHDEDHEDAHE